MAHLGERASLTILREQPFGLFLDAGDKLGCKAGVFCGKRRKLL